MTTLAIELNDAGLVAVSGARPDELVSPPSPGYAVWTGDKFVTGREAEDKARLQPRFTHSGFWNALDTEPLKRPFPSGLSRADLAHAHLTTFWKRVGNGIADVLLTVPAWSSDEQLGLMLGIAESCGIPVRGLVADAVAAAASYRAPEDVPLLYVDAQLRRAMAATLSSHPDIMLGSVRVEEHVGLTAIKESWIDLIAKAFVRQTRFDPLHVAATEQKLYHRLSHWIDELSSQGSAELVMEGGGKQHAIELTRDDLVRAVASHYDALTDLVASSTVAAEPMTVLLSHRLGALPGLIDRLARDDWTVVVLPPAAAAQGALARREAIRSSVEPGQELTYVTAISLNGGPEPTSTLSGSTSAAVTEPTHVLHEGVAYPITDEPFFIGIDLGEAVRGISVSGATAGISRSHCSIYREDGAVVVSDHSSYGSFVNDQRVDGRASLAVGDRLRLGTPGVELDLIRVES